MGKTVTVLSVTFLYASIILITCISPSPKDGNEEEKATEIKKNSSDYQKFKIENENRVAANGKNITRLKTKMEIANKENKAIYETKLADLEKRNSRLKTKLIEFKADNVKDWPAFKTDFEYDMDELGEAFNNFTFNNAN